MLVPGPMQVLCMAFSRTLSRLVRSAGIFGSCLEDFLHRRRGIGIGCDLVPLSLLEISSSMPQTYLACTYQRFVPRLCGQSLSYTRSTLSWLCSSSLVS